MANVRKIEGKNGISYKITVTSGRDLDGRQIRHYKTWTPEHGMTARQMEKAVQKMAFEFEKEIELGFQADNRQTFAQYAAYVIDLKERTGAKRRTVDRYRELLQRINPAIGHIKLADLRPQHLNAFYKNLGEPRISNHGDKAQAKTNLYSEMKKKGLSRAKVAQLAGLSSSTVTTACQGKKIALATARAIAGALEKPVEKLFSIELGGGQLSPKTILNTTG